MSESNDYIKAKLVVDEEMEGGAKVTAKGGDDTAGDKDDVQYPHEDDYNCCVSCIIRTFKKMYPSHPKIAYTIQGQKLR